MRSHSWLLLITYLLIKATSNPAPMGSKIVGITKATENYSDSLLVSVVLVMPKGLKGWVSHVVFTVLSIGAVVTGTL